MSNISNPNESAYRRVEWDQVRKSRGPAGGTHFSVRAGADVRGSLAQTVERDGKTYRLVKHAPGLGDSAMYVEQPKW